MAIAGLASASLRCARIIASRSTSQLKTESNLWLNLSKAARLLHVAPKTLAAEAGEIEALHPLPDGPWIFNRAVLSSSPACAITERAPQNPKHPGGSHPDQQSLFSSMT
jgi:hypothetical protein